MQYRRHFLSLLGFQSVCKLSNISPNEPALRRLLFYSFDRRRIRGSLICLYKIAHSLLNLPRDCVFAAPTRPGFHHYTKSSATHDVANTSLVFEQPRIGINCQRHYTCKRFVGGIIQGVLDAGWLSFFLKSLSNSFHYILRKICSTLSYRTRMSTMLYLRSVIVALLLPILLIN